MEAERFILLDIDYFTKQGNPVIRLFGKILDENKPVIALDKNFNPYFYVIPHDIDECIGELKAFKLKKIEKKRKKNNGELMDLLKVTFKHPQEMPKLKEEISKIKCVESVREYDIPFYRRYLIDNGLFPMSEVEVQVKVLKQGLNETRILELQKKPKKIKSGSYNFIILNFKIETCNFRGWPRVSKDPIIMISFSSNYGFQKVFSTKKSSSDFVETVKNEKELLKKFVETIESENPDIIVGYNSDKFDFPYIKGRADILGVSLKLGVDGSKLKFVTVPKKAAMIKGRVHIDLYRIVRRHIQSNSHTIQSVYTKLFGGDKVDVTPSEVYNCWINGGEKLENLFRYSIEDVGAFGQIGEQILPVSMELSRIVGQPLFEIVRRGTGTQVKWYLIRKAHEFNYILPNEPRKFERNIVGGYVQEPLPGLHENIFYFDFRSLYPSIIIAKNISPETLCKNGDEETCHISPEFGHKFKKEPAGFIPIIVSQILNERIRIKNMMKKSTNPEKKQILNFRQEALKTLISTVYGLFNHPQYRWYCIEASDAINAWGRDYLKNAMEDAEMHGLKVLYADTDGFFASLKK